jgi:Xaa-Pro aminopeptidase
MSQLEQLRESMSANGLPALLLTDIANVAWLTGFTGSAGRVLVTADQALFLTDSRYTIQAQEQVTTMPSVSYSNPIDGDDFLAENALRLGIGKLGFEASTLPFATYEKIKRKLGEVEFIPAPDLLSKLRMVKTPDEVKKIRVACKLADATFDYMVGRVQPGRSEVDLNLELEFFIRRNGAELAFPPIVVSGLRSARPHGVASEKLLADGDFLTMDFGAQIDGYNSDITRTVVVGAATDRHKEVYAQVLKAQLASLDALRAGRAAKEVDAIARKILDEKDLAKYFGHGLGHGLGRVVHDAGRLSPSSEDQLEVGQVWTIEPGVYIEGFGGVRIEDDVVLTQEGIEILTHSTKELLELS